MTMRRLKAWEMSRVRFVTSMPPPPKFRDQFTAPNVSKELEQQSVDVVFPLDELAGLHRVEKVWDLQVLPTYSEAILQAWLGCFG